MLGTEVKAPKALVLLMSSSSSSVLLGAIASPKLRSGCWGFSRVPRFWAYSAVVGEK